MIKLNLLNRNTKDEPNIIQYTLIGLNKEKVVLNLTLHEFKLLEVRVKQTFVAYTSKEKILYEINSASNYKALEEIARKRSLCDACSFEDISFIAAKQTLKAIVEILFKYPRLRSKLCFIGTHNSLEQKIIKLEQGNVGTIKEFNLQHICSPENARKLGMVTHSNLTETMKLHEKYVATALYAFGLLDAVLLDRHDYNSNAYLDLLVDVQYAEKVGFHPKKCNTPESLIFHELGHLLDNMCGLSENSEFKAYYRTLTNSAIKDGLSEYALTSMDEVIAEAFAEYMCNPTPRPIALKIGQMLDRLYKKI